MRTFKTYEQYTGLGVAVVTPFDENLNLDVQGLHYIVNHLVNHGVKFLVALGSTGESNLLSAQEQNQALKHIIDTNNKRLPIVVGHCSDFSTAKVIDNIKRITLEGVDALMIASPAYVKPTQEGIYQHYMKIAEYSPLPIIIYNVPGRTSSNITADTICRLAHDSEMFIGVKEASGNIHQMVDILRNRPDHFFVTSGDDDLALAVIAHGGEGLISVVGNALPMEVNTMIEQALHGNFEEASEIQYMLYDIYGYLFSEGNPTGVKAVLEMIGLCNRRVRLPLTSLTDDSYQKLENIIRRIEASIA